MATCNNTQPSGPLSYQVAVHGGTAVWLRHADQMRQSHFKASQGEEEVDMEELEGQSGPSGEGLPDQRQGEQKQNGVQPHPETTHVSVQPQQSASPAHAETDTNVAHTTVLATTVTATQLPRIACEPLGVASRTSADIPQSSEVVTTRSGRIVKKPQRY